MKKKIALLLCAAMVLALAACESKKEPAEATPTPKPLTVTATPTPGQKKTITATPTATPTPKKDWTALPTFTPTPEQIAAKEEAERLAAEEAARAKLDKTYVLDAGKMVKISGELPTVDASGNIVMKDQLTQKFVLPLGCILKPGETARVSVTLQFNTADDTGIRLYLCGSAADDRQSDVVNISNPGTTDMVTKVVTLKATGNANHILVASSGWGVMINDIVIKQIKVSPNPVVDIAALSVASGDAPTTNDDGTISFKGGITQKVVFPLGKQYSAGDVLAVTATAKFNTIDDDQIRFYVIQDGADSAKSAVSFFKNPGHTNPVSQTFLISLNEDANQLLLASGGWGRYINDVQLFEVQVTKAEIVNLSNVKVGSGEIPTILDDGTLQAKDQLTQKFILPIETIDMSAGSTIVTNVNLVFNSADDVSVRGYAIEGTSDVNKGNIVFYENTVGTGETTVSQEITMNENASSLLLGGKGWGVALNDVIIKQVLVYEKPVVPEFKADTTPQTGDNTMMILVVLLGMVAVSGVVFFKKRADERQ